ncbi:hypothetical protein K7957_10480 [Sphingomonas yunnanensis]|uniref:hypothetical protein n=1 Tax=Sphingomonas yunnanensis TaxID=310400 RepID=UPI001CA736D4|nr:hypothetical protein [Sphingomonas yunnanensis]MBY9063354.1 hypothetical protein [Sphingomonas yunnanensis]
MARFSMRWCGENRLFEKRPIESTSVAEARLEIAAAASAFIKGHAAELWIDKVWYVELNDEDEQTLYELKITAKETEQAMSMGIRPS